MGCGSRICSFALPLNVRAIVDILHYVVEHDRFADRGIGQNRVRQPVIIVHIHQASFGFELSFVNLHGVAELVVQSVHQELVRHDLGDGGVDAFAVTLAVLDRLLVRGVGVKSDRLDDRIVRVARRHKLLIAAVLRAVRDRLARLVLERSVVEDVLEHGFDVLFGELHGALRSVDRGHLFADLLPHRLGGGVHPLAVVGIDQLFLDVFDVLTLQILDVIVVSLALVLGEPVGLGLDVLGVVGSLVEFELGLDDVDLLRVLVGGIDGIGLVEVRHVVEVFDHDVERDVLAREGVALEVLVGRVGGEGVGDLDRVEGVDDAVDGDGVLVAELDDALFSAEALVKSLLKSLKVFTMNT